MRKIIYLIACMLVGIHVQAQKMEYNLLIGTYTITKPIKSEGIYVYNYKEDDASTTLKSVAPNLANPSYLTVSPDKKFVYAVNEAGANSGVSAFSYDASTGKLIFLNKKDSRGADPCYLIADDQNVIIANYSGGSLAVFARNADGSLTDAQQVIQHTGKSIDPEKRQESAHAHMVHFTPDKKYIVCTDLGEDQIYIYNYNGDNPKQALSIKTVIKTNAGSGPRHLTFTPDGKFAYVVHEFTGSITAYSYSNGNFNKIQEIGSVDKNFKGDIDAADIHVSPDGRFLYESNRGDLNNISVFSILPTGRLAFKEQNSSLGKGPRNFVIDPSGKHLLVGHQYTNDVVIFNIDKSTGSISDSGKRIDVGAPVCLLFSPVQ
jgi:6-phosphogluconolactonase